MGHFSEPNCKKKNGRADDSEKMSYWVENLTYTFVPKPPEVGWHE
jgi:hypothetical protein